MWLTAGGTHPPSRVKMETQIPLSQYKEASSQSPTPDAIKVGIMVGVLVGIGVLVGVLVCVAVGVLVGEFVNVGVGVGVAGSTSEYHRLSIP
jgi:UDP-3-O-[3-hydroxymyristoyl] glucosamine N-acyltransferase